MPKNLFLLNTIRVFLLLFVVIAVVLGLYQPGYSHLHYTVSYLSIGKYGWIQDINFLLMGFSLLLLGYGIARHYVAYQPARIVAGITRVVAGCSGLLAIFPTELRAQAARYDFYSLSMAAQIHDIVAAFLMMMLVLAKVVTIKTSLPAWKQFRTQTTVSLVITAGFYMLWTSLLLLGYLDYGKGLIQKLGLLNEILWIWMLSKMLVQSFPDKKHS